jgi:hypothetical protein
MIIFEDKCWILIELNFLALKCFKCPRAYHASDYCLPPGSVLIGGQYIMCPKHFEPIKNAANHKRINVRWCFVCCKGGELIECETCPAAYHYDCLPANIRPKLVAPSDTQQTASTMPLAIDTNGERRNGIGCESADTSQDLINNSALNSNSNSNSAPQSPSSNSFTSSYTDASSMVTISKRNGAHSVTKYAKWECEDCMLGKVPLNGDIVWAKVGSYRWWPAQICTPLNAPKAIKESIYQVGEFPVKFFGSNDYYWVSIGRCFEFAENDEADNVSNLKKRLINAFKSGTEQAKLAYKELQRLKSMNSNSRHNEQKSSFKRDFCFIKINKAYGNVQQQRIPISDLQQCDCDPMSPNPCSTDDCVNRSTYYECHPAICPAGERCQNQRFVKRLYVKQEPFKTGDRGWGLRALEFIKKGEFVNEYVGEIIDDEECKRRLDLAHENNMMNFYFLKIEKDR